MESSRDWPVPPGPDTRGRPYSHTKFSPWTNPFEELDAEAARQEDAERPTETRQCPAADEFPCGTCADDEECRLEAQRSTETPAWERDAKEFLAATEPDHELGEVPRPQRPTETP